MPRGILFISEDTVMFIGAPIGNVYPIKLILIVVLPPVNTIPEPLRGTREDTVRCVLSIIDETEYELLLKDIVSPTTKVFVNRVLVPSITLDPFVTERVPALDLVQGTVLFVPLGINGSLLCNA